MWVLDYIEDIDSDMSVLHGVADARTMLPGPLYFERAERLAAYPGVMQARVLELSRQRDALGARGATEVDDKVLLAQLANDGWADYEDGGA